MSTAVIPRGKPGHATIRLGRRMLRSYQLYLFLLPALLYYMLFHYWPIYGLQIAFKDFSAGLGIAGSPWVGLAHFERFVNGYVFADLIRNTLSISVASLLLGFPVPVLLALILNEIRSTRFRRVVQTVSYAPYFISTVVLVSMLMIFLNPEYGIVNSMIAVFGLGPFHFLAKREWFAAIYVISGIWQTAGWSSIVYLAALSGINPELHEAAMIDGASRLKRILHINLPGILPTVTIMFIMATGNIMSVGFEKAFLMQNPLNLQNAEVISTYVYKTGLLQIQYSFSSAVGLFNSLVNFVLLLTVNMVSKKIGEVSLF